jgi:hypothetical protein
VFAEEGILDYILRTLSSTTQLDLELAKQYLRVIGNCVANDVLDGDMDEGIEGYLHILLRMPAEVSWQTSTEMLPSTSCQKSPPA